MGLLETREQGLYCAAGDFWIDPWAPVGRAVITHAHADHAVAGSGACLTAREGETLLRARLGPEAAIESLAYGESVSLGGVRVSLHPAGHILGSAQVRLELGGETWAVSGDYKTEADPTCAAFEPLACHTFVTESTFALPIFRWPAAAGVLAAIDAWWRSNQAAGKTSVLFAYPLGKAQRILASLDPATGPIAAHGSVERFNALYREWGVPLPATLAASGPAPPGGWSRALVLAPPDASSLWLRRFGAVSTAFASGWMRIRGARRRRALDRGFVLSDHAGWPDLLAAIDATGAERVWTVHGFREPLARWLSEHGRTAEAIETRWESEPAQPPPDETSP